MLCSPLIFLHLAGYLFDPERLSGYCLALKPRTKKMRADSLVRFLLILCVAIILLQLVIRRSTPQMIDAIPEGFTTLPAAVTLLAATIAEVDVARAGRLLETPSNDNSDDDPFALRFHRDSLNGWEKRELAISKLQAGLNTGELEASVRIPESGVMFTSNRRIGEVLRSVTKSFAAASFDRPRAKASNATPEDGS